MGEGARMVVPYVVEQGPRGERTMDVYSRLLNDRIIFLGTPVDDQVWLGLVWLVAILVIFAPLAVWRYRRVATK